MVTGWLPRSHGFELRPVPSPIFQWGGARSILRRFPTASITSASSPHRHAADIDHDGRYASYARQAARDWGVDWLPGRADRAQDAGRAAASRRISILSMPRRRFSPKMQEMMAHTMIYSSGQLRDGILRCATMMILHFRGALRTVRALSLLSGARRDARRAPAFQALIHCRCRRYFGTARPNTPLYRRLRLHNRHFAHKHLFHQPK